MAWYVFALVDRLPAGRQGRGLAGAIAARRVPGGFAIVERRADVPPADLGSLKAHDAVVARVAAAVPSILPVRFGTLMETEEIEEALQDREEEIAEAFAVVRDRVQFTWRRGGALGARGARGARGAEGAEGARGARGYLSGSEYLRQAADAVKAAPAAFRSVRDKLRPLVAAERYQSPTASLPESLYHLVERENQSHYRAAADSITSASAAVRVSGPFPPFAFTPELL